MTENLPLYVTIGVLMLLNIYLTVKLWGFIEFKKLDSVLTGEIKSNNENFLNHNNRIIDADKRLGYNTDILRSHWKEISEHEVLRKRDKEWTVEKIDEISIFNIALDVKVNNIHQLLVRLDKVQEHIISILDVQINDEERLQEDFSDLVLYVTELIAAHQTEIENLKRRRK